MNFFTFAGDARLMASGIDLCAPSLRPPKHIRLGIEPVAGWLGVFTAS